MAWAAAHFPCAVIGVLAHNANLSAEIYLIMWLASGVAFGIFATFAIRTVFGSGFGIAIATALVSSVSFTLGLYVFGAVSPWALSPFLILLVVIYFGGFLTGELRSFGDAFKRRQNFPDIYAPQLLIPETLMPMFSLDSFISSDVNR
jgi:hypothetical protein